MKNTEKDRLIRALMTVVAPLADAVDEGDDCLIANPFIPSRQQMIDAYAVYWMARAMGYRANTSVRGLASLGQDTCEAQRADDDR